MNQDTGDTEFKYIPQAGDVFEWNTEQFLCVEANEREGIAKPLNKNFNRQMFIATCKPEFPKFIKHEA
jgi:hypothetical protein